VRACALLVAVAIGATAVVGRPVPASAGAATTSPTSTAPTSTSPAPPSPATTPSTTTAPAASPASPTSRAPVRAPAPTAPATTIAPTATSVANLQVDTVDTTFLTAVEAEVGSAQQALGLTQAAQAKAHAEADHQAALLAAASERVQQLNAAQQQAVTAVQAADRHLRDLAVSAYVTGGPGTPVNVLLSAETIGDFARRRAIFSTVANESTDALKRDQKARAQADAATLKSLDTLRRTQAARTAADQRAAAVDAAVAKAAAVLADRQNLLTLTRDALSIPGTDIPRMVLDAYQRAALKEQALGCRIGWWGLAGIGKVESNHGRAQQARLSPTGELDPPILGVPLTGQDGTQLVPASSGAGVDRAEGPMQFIASTWAKWGRNGRGDLSPPDVNNVYDAALGAAAYLCAASTDLLTDDGLKTAYFSYNHSTDYVTEVLTYARAYQAADVAGDVPPLSPAPLYALAPPTTAGPGAVAPAAAPAAAPGH